MPKFLENKLKQEYGANSSIPYKIMNKMGVMKGNKETAKGMAMDKKHEKDMGKKKMMMQDKEMEKMKKEHHSGKGTRSRLNTAAEKKLFGSNYSK